MTRIPESELVLNADGSVYHLNLHPEQVAPTIITVGDPKRVAMVSNYFDRLEVTVRKREFITHTGEINGTRLTVLSTGIGPDNIDIALNELDALFNIDLKTRAVRSEITPLRIVRVGTSGSLSPQLGVDNFVVSAFGLGLDNLMDYYPWKPSEAEAALAQEATHFLSQQGHTFSSLYAAGASSKLLADLAGDMVQGITITSPGFYGPQGRSLRIKSRLSSSLFAQLPHFSSQGYSLTNFEMETSAIYSLARLMGHHAISFNAILANRANATFSQQPRQSILRLIETVLERLTR
jgi:uridine phosphorylase